MNQTKQVAVAGPGKALVPGQLPAGQEPAQEAQVNWKGLLQQGAPYVRRTRAHIHAHMYTGAHVFVASH